MAKVYVVNAQAPNGGGYMAYHIGRLISQQYGYLFIDVPSKRFGAPIFTYDTPMQQVSVEEMEKNISNDDVLVCNPAASSAHQFGLRLPGKKIMYVQGFQTFSFLDCHFDIYASASSVVSNFLHATYGIIAPIISPFIVLEHMPKTIPWNMRPSGSAIVYMKARTNGLMHIFMWMKKILGELCPEIELEDVTSDYHLSHSEFLKKIGSARYLLNISTGEGFGLVPLEAMALGTIPFGLDGLAGKDYMRYGQNSFCLSYKDLNYQNLQKMVMDLHRHENQPPFDTMQLYSRTVFYQRWNHLIKGLLNVG